MPRKRVAILISGRGSNMSALIAAAAAADYPTEIVLVISNRPEAAGLKKAAAASIPTCVVDHVPFGKHREEFEHQIHLLLKASNVEIVCLAGFMRLLTPWFVQRWEGKMLNVHPALLPSFKGVDTHARALAAGVKMHGASVHFVVDAADSGPILAQGAVPVFEDDTADTLAARVLAVEHRIYPLALKLLAEDRVRIVDGRCIIEGAARISREFIVPEPGK